MAAAKYTEDNIRSLDWKEHIRMRPGMYIGKLGDGSSPDDGIYILLKEVIDNCIDEFVMGAGKTIEIRIKDKEVKQAIQYYKLKKGENLSIISRKYSIPLSEIKRLNPKLNERKLQIGQEIRIK